MADRTDLSLYLCKLEKRSPFSEAARTAFLALPVRQEQFPANHTIVSEGGRPTRSCLLTTGFVSRNKSLRNGQRQIVGFHVPGDMVDLQSALVMVADHSIQTHSPSTMLTIAHADLLEIAARFPEVGRTLWFDTLVDAAIFREWTLNVGARTAAAGTAHLLLEMHYRLKTAGLAEDGSFELPVSQAELADAVGISAVHMNRSLQALRGQKLIRTFRKTVTIENMPAMVELAEFTPGYMHPEGPRALPAT